MIKFIIGLGLLLITGFSLITGNETIFPSAIVILILFLLSLRKRLSDNSQGQGTEIVMGKSAQLAIKTSAVFFAIMSLLVSIFFPAIAVFFKIDGLFDGDFVRVTINDMHEFCYSICLLLIMEAVFYFFLRRKERSLKRPNEAVTNWNSNQKV